MTALEVFAETSRCPLVNEGVLPVHLVAGHSLRAPEEQEEGREHERESVIAEELQRTPPSKVQGAKRLAAACSSARCMARSSPRISLRIPASLAKPTQSPRHAAKP